MALSLKKGILKMYLRGVDAVRSVEFARTYLWDCKIKGAPAPFNQWFPAESVDDSLTSMDNPINFTFDLLTMAVPGSGVGVRTLKMVFLDDRNRSLIRYFKRWIDDIVDVGGGVVPLEEAVRQFEIQKLTPQRKSLEDKYYWIYPSSNITEINNSNSQLQKIQLDFIVAGEQIVPHKERYAEGNLAQGIVAEKQFDLVQNAFEFSDKSMIGA